MLARPLGECWDNLHPLLGADIGPHQLNLTESDSMRPLPLCAICKKMALDFVSTRERVLGLMVSSEVNGMGGRVKGVGLS
jgi:hypothetical protein